jgi:hypothetical protein
LGERKTEAPDDISHLSPYQRKRVLSFRKGSTFLPHTLALIAGSDLEQKRIETKKAGKTGFLY